jgi:hypothetical protein
MVTAPPVHGTRGSPVPFITSTGSGASGRQLLNTSSGMAAITGAMAARRRPSSQPSRRVIMPPLESPVT